MNLISSKIIDGIKVSLFQKVLDVSSARHRAIASNVANISTPGYHRKYVDFDREMKKALSNGVDLRLKTTNPHHLSAANNPDRIEVMTEKDNSASNGINNVDIDKEMGNLAENQIIYNTAARLLSFKFRNLKYAIKGR